MLAGSLSKVTVHVVYVWESGMNCVFWKCTVCVFPAVGSFSF